MLLATFALTVLVDLTVAIEVGIVLASIIFMHRMAEATAIEKGVSLIERDQDDFSVPGRSAYAARDELPKGVEMFELRGPLFLARKPPQRRIRSGVSFAKGIHIAFRRRAHDRRFRRWRAQPLSEAMRNARHKSPDGSQTIGKVGA